MATQVDKEREEKRKRVAPWISQKQWAALDKLSTIPPFNQPNRGNMEANLVTHIENHPNVWYNYVNDKDFLNSAINQAAKKMQTE